MNSEGEKKGIVALWFESIKMVGERRFELSDLSVPNAAR
jgi:hypothetical protein